MEWLKVMWGRKKSGIDMVMVNESRERERERGREGKEAGGPGDMRLVFRCGTPGVWRSEEVTAERSGQNKGPRWRWKWEFDKHGTTLRDNKGDNLLTGHL